MGMEMNEVTQKNRSGPNGIEGQIYVHDEMEELGEAAIPVARVHLHFLFFMIDGRSKQGSGARGFGVTMKGSATEW